MSGSGGVLPGAAGGRAEDRCAGFYVVRETWQNTSGVNTFWSSDNPLLEEYGSTAVDLGKYGTHAFPDLVLFARKEGGNYVFPGLEGGFSLFILHPTQLNKTLASY